MNIPLQIIHLLLNYVSCQMVNFGHGGRLLFVYSCSAELISLEINSIFEKKLVV
jgi:hypothetical protein